MACAVLVAAHFLFAGASWADDITITSAGGQLVITGRLIGYDGTYLQIESAHGPLTVTYARVTCAGVACPDPDNFVPTIRLSGAANMAKLLVPALVEGFGRAQGFRVDAREPDATRLDLVLTDADGQTVAIFAFHATTTDEGFADLIAYENDIVLAAREVSGNELSRAAEVGLGALDSTRQSRILALDGLVPVVSLTQSLAGLSLQDLAGLYAGQIGNWRDVGGADAAVHLHLGAESLGWSSYFKDRILGIDDLPLADGVTRHDSVAAIAQAVADDRGAVGIIPFSEAGTASVVGLKDGCGFVMVPGVTTLKTQDYPLTLPLFLYLPDRRQAPVVADFLRWLGTPEALLVVRRAGFVDRGAVPIALEAQGQRLANAVLMAGDRVPLTAVQTMVGALVARTRLSASFRFDAATRGLDVMSRANVLDLARDIHAGRYAGRALLLAGFSDGAPDSHANRALSGQYAVAVKEALLDLLGGAAPADVRIGTRGFGEAMPLSCDDTALGHQMNNRVELWVKN